MGISIEQIKEIREKTGAGIMDCRQALEKANGDLTIAVEFLREKGLAKAKKRSDREASEGVIDLYSHGDGRVGVMVEVNCETDFVARSESFRTFAHELALQIAAASPLWISEEDVPEEAVTQEKEMAEKLAKEEGKPDNIIPRIVEGKLGKYMDEVVLLRQKYIRDDEKNIQDLLNEHVSAIGENIVIRRFQRWELGDHVEK
jgi:elongation factor Ts